MYMQKSKQAKIRSILGKVKQWKRGESIKRDSEKEKKMGENWGKRESDTCKRKKEDKRIRWDLWR